MANANGTNPEEISTVSLISLGCPKNLVDSEKMLGLLVEDGLIPVSSEVDGGGARADAIVINTCGFLEASREESLDVIGEALESKRRGEVKRVIVAGCLVQRHRAKLLEWAPGIDALVGVFDRDRIAGAVRGGSPQRELPDRADRPPYWIAASALQAARARGIKPVRLTVAGSGSGGVGYFEDDTARLRLTPRHYAYLRISEGCNQNCAFCTIPSIRGKMRSKPLESIVREARELIDDGAFELNLIGQDTTSYAEDLVAPDGGRDGLPDLLGSINEVIDRHAGGQGWARLMYAYPSTFTDEMIDALANLSHICKYIDMPLQHASDRILTRMRRNVSAARQEDLIARLRDRCPSIALRTTLITGFPGETEEDHEELLEFVERTRFDALGVFEYSRESGTRAGTMDLDPDLHVTADVKARRHEQIMSLQQRIAFDRAADLAVQFDPDDPERTGARLDVLIDRVLESEPGAESWILEGRTRAQAPEIDSIVRIGTTRRTSPGELVRCAIIGSDGYDLIGAAERDLSKDVRLPLA